MVIGKIVLGIKFLLNTDESCVSAAEYCKNETNELNKRLMATPANTIVLEAPFLSLAIE